MAEAQLSTIQKKSFVAKIVFSKKQLAQRKSSDPHAVLANLMNNKEIPKEEQVQEYQRLRLDLWDMPGSASSCGITHQVLFDK